MEALPDLAIAATALATWIRPEAVGPRTVRYFVLLMLLEFIVVHSAGFMGMVALGRETPAAKARAMLGFGVLYSLFLVGFCVPFGEWWPMAAFWGLALNRLLGGLASPALGADARLQVQREWAAAVVCYLVAVFATVLLPVPRLGITPSIVAGQDLPGSGLWISQPHRVVACAALYYGLMGWSKLAGHRWLGRGTLRVG